MKAILGRKKGMTRILEDGKVIPVTVIDTSDCVVANVGEGMVELGINKKKGNKAEVGRYKSLGFVPKFTKKFRSNDDISKLKVGDKIEALNFSVGDKVCIKAKSKGKGFAGGVKRWGFSGGPKTHGQSDSHRAIGSIGSGMQTARVFRGKKMPGRMGGENITMKNKKIVDIVDDYLLLTGTVPGSNGEFVLIYAQKEDES